MFQRCEEPEIFGRGLQYCGVYVGIFRYLPATSRCGSTIYIIFICKYTGPGIYTTVLQSVVQSFKVANRKKTGDRSIPCKGNIVYSKAAHMERVHLK